MRKIFLFLFTGFFLTVSAQTDVVIKDLWIRAVPPSLKNTALFMVIENKSDKEDVLVSVKTDIAKMSMIHKTINENGIMKMVHVHELKIPPYSKIELKPGGIHIMLMGLKRPLKEGEKISIELIFKNAGSIKIKAPVLMR